jgi:hypothetical protein
MNKAAGRWAGIAEVYDGQGRYLGSGADQRHVLAHTDGLTRIDVSFVGPLVMSGHYVIKDCGDHRLYQGPANVGYAETLSDSLIDANAYWAGWGLSQRFFLMTSDDGATQFSLALMSRGEQVLYTIIGENHRVEDVSHSLPPTLAEQMIVSGTAYDRQDDPCAGRGCLLLHREGVWRGTLTALNAGREIIAQTAFEERVQGGDRSVILSESGGHFFNACDLCLTTNGWQAWTGAGDVVGSYNLSGGRARSGQFHDLRANVRVWRREVASCDGSRKAVVRVNYRGGERIGIEYGLLTFEGTAHG